MNSLATERHASTRLSMSAVEFISSHAAELQYYTTHV